METVHLEFAVSCGLGEYSQVAFTFVSREPAGATTIVVCLLLPFHALLRVAIFVSSANCLSMLRSFIHGHVGTNHRLRYYLQS